MKRRSAMTIAGGLVAAMLAGAVALSLGFAGGPAAVASSGRHRPEVRTIERTIKVHKKQEADAPPVVRTISAPAPASASGPRTAGSSDDSFEDDAFEGGFEGDDHESLDDGHDSEDHEGDGGFEDD